MLCEELAGWFTRTAFNLIMEPKCYNGQRIMERPGHIKIDSLVIDHEDSMHMYLNFTVWNVFANLHFGMTQNRIWLENKLEETNVIKCRNRNDIMRLECQQFGGMSSTFKTIHDEYGW